MCYAAVGGDVRFVPQYAQCCQSASTFRPQLGQAFGAAISPAGSVGGTAAGTVSTTACLRETRTNATTATATNPPASTNPQRKKTAIPQFGRIIMPNPRFGIRSKGSIRILARHITPGKDPPVFPRESRTLNNDPAKTTHAVEYEYGGCCQAGHHDQAETDTQDPPCCCLHVHLKSHNEFRISIAGWNLPPSQGGISF